MKDFYTLKSTFFVVFITICFIFSCNPSDSHSKRFETQTISVSEQLPVADSIDTYVKPYREHINKEMSEVLAYNPTDLIKESNKLNTAIGNFMADASYEIISERFTKNQGKEIDFLLLNWGGIRSDLPKGNITTRSAYSLMPFENQMVILEMTGNKVNELVQYLAKTRKSHPLSKQVQLQINTEGQMVSFFIKGKAFDPRKNYIVATSDYLLNGGDGMFFFQDAVNVYETNYAIRNVLIDYFKKIDTLHTKEDNRFMFSE